MYLHTHTWFTESAICAKLCDMVDVSAPHTILEIGCYEGLSSVFFADKLLAHPDSTLTCVDPFLTIDNNDHSNLMSNQTEEYFDANIRSCLHPDKITVHKVTSDAFFPQNKATYDIIYIDGCHELDFIKRDMENSFAVLRPGGIMWMDDYLGGDNIKIKAVMDRFLQEHEGEYDVIFKDYQLAIRRRCAASPATRAYAAGLPLTPAPM